MARSRVNFGAWFSCHLISIRAVSIDLYSRMFCVCADLDADFFFGKCLIAKF
jgi:hypothetical protein